MHTPLAKEPADWLKKKDRFPSAFPPGVSCGAQGVSREPVGAESDVSQAFIMNGLLAHHMQQAPLEHAVHVPQVQCRAQQFLPEAVVQLLHNADTSIWKYGPDAPRLQVGGFGTASQRGDFDARGQLAVAERETLLLAILRCDVEGNVEVADACLSRRMVVSAFLPQLAEGNKGDVAAFSLPFNSCKSATKKRIWLAAQIVFALHGAQDFAKAVMVRRDGMADKTLWLSTVCASLDRWLAANKGAKVTLQGWFDSLARHATGMLRGVVHGGHFNEFQDEFCRSIYAAGQAKIWLTRQGEQALAAWCTFCGVCAEDNLDLVFPTMDVVPVREGDVDIAGAVRTFLDPLRERKANEW
jgi:hypothetical protein